MRPWEIVDHEPVPDDDGTIYLMSRGREWVIHVDGRELMGSKKHGSEDALADLACDQLGDLHAARVLVGGLGMGFTQAAVLRRIGPEGNATVAELMPAVIRWNREYLGKVARFPLRDSRSTVYNGDVGDLIEAPPAPWSAILLDVDNGPRALTRPNNGWLYTVQGIAAARKALIPGGVLAIWSALPDAALTRRLRKGGFKTEMCFYTEAGRPTFDDSGSHVIWIAVAPGG